MKIVVSLSLNIELKYIDWFFFFQYVYFNAFFESSFLPISYIFFNYFVCDSSFKTVKTNQTS